jgi:NADH-quinone oxidoreductase subunit L
VVSRVVGNAWIVPALPFAAYILIVFVGPRMRERSAYFGVVAMGLASVLGVAILFQAIGGARAHVSVPWLQIGPYNVPMGFTVDPLSAVMLAMVTVVSWMIEIYSMGYMHGDPEFNRFYANVNLFVTGMLTAVIADNFLLFLMAWEIMGLCSYLLIGHWYKDPNNARAATKAFLVTRIGDVGLMAGIWWIFSITHTFQFDKLAPALHAAALAPAVLTAIVLLVFMGPLGKSAQIPLHIWLPDAMAGPTPVSALIHAATMVAVGVYLVARTYPIFQLSPTALVWVGYIGAITAFMAATIACVQTDIKKVLAYSTVSQLGYMMLGMGVAGAMAAGMFHLITHAFFKGLLFLGAGSIIHAVETQEMHKMGGLFRKMKATSITFLIASLALAGIPPFSGYFSKDPILAAAYSSPYPIMFWLGLLGAFLTAYYMTRACLLTFFGKPRDPHIYDHAHESPAVMTVPLWVMAVPAALLGLVVAGGFGGFLSPGYHTADGGAGATVLTLSFPLLGVLVGALIYGSGRTEFRAAAIRALKPLYVFLKQKWYFDQLGLALMYIVLAIAWIAAAVDRYIVDGIVNGLGYLAGLFGRAGRVLADGSAQAYMLTLLLAVAVGLIALQLIGG